MARRIVPHIDDVERIPKALLETPGGARRARRAIRS
jgi:phage baseplate assembly protein W